MLVSKHLASFTISSRGRFSDTLGSLWHANRLDCTSLRPGSAASGVLVARTHHKIRLNSGGVVVRPGDISLSFENPKFIGEEASQSLPVNHKCSSMKEPADGAYGQGVSTLHYEGDEGVVPDACNETRLEFESRFLRCCEQTKKLKVGVLVSGGVDSSVALRLLCAAGHSCTAFYLKIWFQEDFENFWSACPWDEDLKYAQDVCDEIGVELNVVHLTEEYWKSVVLHMIAEYHAGRTPNPDILCNSRIKFGSFLDKVKDMGFDKVASGHYACVEHKSTSQGENRALLRLSQDEVKDQTYFLSHLSQTQLSRLIFPLGCIKKEEVRQLARWMGLSNKDRKDSQGICFLGKVKFNDFIKRHLGEREGYLLEAETGDCLGTHKGYWFYTIGQRQGLCLSNGPWYVVDKDLESNVVFISRNYFSGDKRRREFHVSSLNWVGGCPPSNLIGLRCKVRHGQKFYHCSLDFTKSNTNRLFEGTLASESFTSAFVRLAEDDQGIAAGQYAAFYDGDVCLGSGIISDSVVGQSPCVTLEARKAARMAKVSVPCKRKRGEIMSGVNAIKGQNLAREKHPCVKEMPFLTSFKSWINKFLFWLTDMRNKC